jgi:hypothetical protein
MVSGVGRLGPGQHRVQDGPLRRAGGEPRVVEAREGFGRDGIRHYEIGFLGRALRRETFLEAQAGTSPLSQTVKRITAEIRDSCGRRPILSTCASAAGDHAGAHTNLRSAWSPRHEAREQRSATVRPIATCALGRALCAKPVKRPPLAIFGIQVLPAPPTIHRAMPSPASRCRRVVV